MKEIPHGFELGPLEAEIMRVIWDKGSYVPVTDVQQALEAGERPLAYTTVMTVLSRLHARGLLERRKEGRAYVYRAVAPREELAGTTLKEWMQRYWGGKIMPAVSMLLGSERLSDQDVDALRRLVAELEAKKGES